MDSQEGNGGVDIDYFLENLSEEPNARKIGGIMIIIGSILGIQLGIVLFSADPGEVLSGSLDSGDQYSDISGIVNSALTDNSSGGDPVEGVRVRLLNEDGTTTGKETLTDENGRFSIPEVVRQSSILFISHPDNESTKILLNPGDNAQIVVTLTPGEGEKIIDLRGESHLGDSVIVATAIALFTLFFGISGVFGGIEAYKGTSYRRAWWLAFLGLWSRGMIFLGPLVILVGMGLVTLTKDQFSSGPS
ncbi:MAG TPA: carboxypeptidase-like regulatory domain-containing protein [Candidatus Thalassarchaeaceae archaeon]|mgnify:CR=1|nr:carboxypeptidase-like regulatory domain-containing protein [Candidatus Thalassarchaeaceae archaeon]|tara:strand:- start:1853 stop:2593 length:741 start_codon:yes stop_codon:yes gene_type:complete